RFYTDASDGSCTAGILAYVDAVARVVCENAFSARTGQSAQRAISHLAGTGGDKDHLLAHDGLFGAHGTTRRWRKLKGTTRARRRTRRAGRQGGSDEQCSHAAAANRAPAGPAAQEQAYSCARPDWRP